MRILVKEKYTYIFNDITKKYMEQIVNDIYEAEAIMSPSSNQTTYIITKQGVRATITESKYNRDYMSLKEARKEKIKKLKNK